MRKGHEENADSDGNKVNSLKVVNSCWNTGNCYNFVLEQSNWLLNLIALLDNSIPSLSLSDTHLHYIQVDSNYTPLGINQSSTAGTTYLSPSYTHA